MMTEYKNDELMEMLFQNVPEVDMEFMLGDVAGFNIEGLEDVAGVYVMIHEPTDEILYIGESVNLGIRMYQHKAGVINRSPIRTVIAEALGEAEADKQINNEIKVQIILESKQTYRKIYKNVLKIQYDPKYNISRWDSRWEGL